MGRPVLLALGVVGVGVHGSISRIHGGQKQKDIKSDPNLRSRLFWGADASDLRVATIFGEILFRTLITVITDAPYSVGYHENASSHPTQH